MLHDPKCRFDYPLAPVRLHHPDIFSNPQADLLQPRLALQDSSYKYQAQDHVQRVQHQNQKPPTEQLIPCWHARAQTHRIQKKDVTCSRTSPRPGEPGREICNVK
ncbi:unnamed protein product, partial [Prunus brigantina]